jgi:hypothetical protein
MIDSKDRDSLRLMRAEWAPPVEYIYFRIHYGFTGESKQPERRNLPEAHVQILLPWEALQ